MTNRDIHLDFLKVIGLLCVILAHVNISPLVFQLRNFDVPLLVICSGTLFRLSMMRSDIPAFDYIRKRAVRLVLPSWIFLSIFFLVQFGISLFTGKTYMYSLGDMGAEYFFRSKIIGLWIIRVFLLIAFAAPFLLLIHKRVSATNLLLGIAAVLVLQELVHYVSLSALSGSSIAFRILKISLFQFMPYACLCMLGMVLPSLEKKLILRLALLSLAIFVTIFTIRYLQGLTLPTQEFKDPPRLYYLAYSIGVTLLLYLTFQNFTFNNSPFRKLVLFMSSSTLWIYLWHWLFLEYVPVIFMKVPLLSGLGSVLPLLHFAAVVILATGITYIQKISVLRLITLLKPSERTSRLLSVAFLQ